MADLEEFMFFRAVKFLKYTTKAFVIHSAVTAGALDGLLILL